MPVVQNLARIEREIEEDTGQKLKYHWSKNIQEVRMYPIRSSIFICVGLVSGES